MKCNDQNDKALTDTRAAAVRRDCFEKSTRTRFARRWGDKGFVDELARWAQRRGAAGTGVAGCCGFVVSGSASLALGLGGGSSGSFGVLARGTLTVGGALLTRATYRTARKKQQKRNRNKDGVGT